MEPHFFLAFFGLLRISEFAISNSQTRHILAQDDVTLFENFVKLQIRSSKIDQLNRGMVLSISRQVDQSICPHSLLHSFLKSRPPFHGPLFCHFNGTPQTRYQVVTILKKCLDLLGVSQKGFSSHSFRIGAATSMSLSGFSDEEGIKAGRWRSAAFKGYIR